MHAKTARQTFIGVQFDVVDALTEPLKALIILITHFKYGKIGSINI